MPRLVSTRLWDPVHDERIQRLRVEQMRAELAELGDAQESHSGLNLIPHDCTISTIICYPDKRDSLSMACVTPSCPYVKPYKNGRPIPTPLAPRHRALTTSVPRRTPPSRYISHLSKTWGARQRSSSRVYNDGGAVSKARPLCKVSHRPTREGRDICSPVITEINGIHTEFSGLDTVLNTLHPLQPNRQLCVLSQPLQVVPVEFGVNKAADGSTDATAF